MLPGAVVLWPDRAGGMEVAAVERLSWGTDTLTIVLKGGRRIPVRVTPETLVALRDHHAEMHRLLFLQSPPLIIGATAP